jgi:2-dehydro-3-deoxyphosphooctonate aldolase (KDO 8-P synthase)
MINHIPNIRHTGSGNFFLLAGPCVVEGEQITFDIAKEIQAISDRLKIPFIFKASYRKANRSRADSYTGMGDEAALEILSKVKSKLNVPVVTDIHESGDAAIAATVADVLQIPAFLCRQTELLLAAGMTGKTVNIKKGQFLSGDAMRFAVDKIKSTGNNHVMLTERGNSFGYQDLVVDYRNIYEMQKNNVPVILDVTHSLQQPNQPGGITGGRPELIGLIAKAGIAVGADGIFIETHPDPANAKSDGANMLRLDLLEKLLKDLVAIRSLKLS